MTLAVTIFYLLLQSCVGLIPTSPYLKSSICRISPSLRASNVISNLVDEDLNTRYDSVKELKTFLDADIYPGDNYWAGTIKRFRSQFNKATNDSLRREISDKYDVLLDMALERRIQVEADEFRGTYLHVNTNDIPLHYFSNHAAQRSQLLSQSREMKDLTFIKMKKDLVARRRGALNLLPPVTHRIFDYVASLYKAPTKLILLRNFVFGSLFSTLMLYNTGKRMITFVVAGNLVMCSLLLSRGMPPKKSIAGGDRRIINWSLQSWSTAFGLIGLFAAPSLLATKFALSTFSPGVSSKLQWSISFALGVMAAAVGTTFFEVYETVENGGWRWKNVENGYLPAELESSLREQVFGSSVTSVNDLVEGYDFHYDPDVDDANIDATVFDNDSDSKLKSKMSGVDIKAETLHYENWLKERKEMQRKPPSLMQPEQVQHSLGLKPDFFDTSISEDIQDNYGEIIRRMNPWRKKKLQHKKQIVDDAIIGPYAFRDKTPTWLDAFSQIFSDSSSHRQKIARRYGTYRKSMYKKDDQVVLLPSDGAKDKPKSPSKSDMENENGENGIEDFINEQDDQL
jgi:hypothetical protein